MSDEWFTECADELARCLVEARRCAEACEAYLESLQGSEKDIRHAVDAVAAPAAIARVLIDLIDQPPQLVLAAVRLCRDVSLQAVGSLDGGGPSDVVAALRRTADAADELLRAAG